MEEELFNQLVDSVFEMKAIMRGEKEPSRVFVFQEPDVKAIRAKHNLSQSRFAAMMGISIKTLQNWEQGRRKPEGPARVLLLVADKHPEAIWDSIQPTQIK